MCKEGNGVIEMMAVSFQECGKRKGGVCAVCWCMRVVHACADCAWLFNEAQPEQGDEQSCDGCVRTTCLRITNHQLI